MTTAQPQGELDGRFSSLEAQPTPWGDARHILETAGVYWISTIRSNSSPHVTSIAGVWLDESFYFTTGPDEQKGKNLAANRKCVITTGCNTFGKGLDVVIEGDAVRVGDEPLLRRLADGYAAKYDDFFGFTVRNGAFVNGAGGEALVYMVAAAKILGFSKGDPFSQTRWRFDDRSQ